VDIFFIDVFDPGRSRTRASLTNDQMVVQILLCSCGTTLNLNISSPRKKSDFKISSLLVKKNLFGSGQKVPKSEADRPLIYYVSKVSLGWVSAHLYVKVISKSSYSQHCSSSFQTSCRYWFPFPRVLSPEPVLSTSL